MARRGEVSKMQVRNISQAVMKLKDIAVDVACMLDESPTSMDLILLQNKLDKLINKFDKEE